METVALHHNRPLRIAGTTTIECLAGQVWLTVSGGGDTFLRPGERYALTWPEMALVEALGSGGARIVLHAPAPFWRRVDRSPSRRNRLLPAVLSSLHELLVRSLRTVRRFRRRNPLAG